MAVSLHLAGFLAAPSLQLQGKGQKLLLDIVFINGFVYTHYLLFIKILPSLAFIFVFISFTPGDRLKKILLQFLSKSVLPMLSSKSCIMSGLTFRSLI